MSAAAELVPIALVQRAHGLAGELRVRPHNADTEMLAKGRRVLVTAAGEKTPTWRKIVAARSTDAALLIKLEGVTTRTEAEAFHGAELFVERGSLPELDEGEFYAHDIIGARVEDLSGALIGHVRSFDSYPTCDVLSVETSEGARLEFPLVDDVVESVDAAAKLVRVKSREGL
ncbi:MAG: ribosome maturation factor RimM [Polyangiaceae bacterium]